MDRISVKEVTDKALIHGTKASLAKERGALAEVLVQLAEIIERKLYVPAGYESMHEYCIREFHLSKQSAYKRIHAAKAALEFPAILESVAAGALGLSAVNDLAPYLTAENAAELLAAVAFKPREELRQTLAEWFPQAAVDATIEPIAETMPLVATPGGDGVEFAPARVQGVVSPPQVMPLATDLYKLSLTMTGAMYAKLRRALELSGRRKPVPGEAEILELGLDLVVARLEKKKLAATDRPRAARRSESIRYIPNEVKREVSERDGGQCTFKSDDGTRCTARMGLEWEHIVPVARGGTSEASNIRLLCRAHNQYEAERVYGKSFMQNKRELAQAAAQKRRAEKEAEREQARASAAQRRAEREAKKAAQEALDNDELMPGLRGLGCTIAEARSVLAKVGRMEGFPLEARLKRCPSELAAPHQKIMPNGAVAN